MVARKPDPEPSEQSEGGGLSPAALVVYISPDMLANWRLQKSMALDNAEWALKVGRPDIAAMNVKGARFAHLQILRIKAHVRKRRGAPPIELARLEQRVKELRYDTDADESAAALGAGADRARSPGERLTGERDRRGAVPEHQDRVDVPHARDVETQAPGGHLGRDADPSGSREGPRRVSPRQQRKHPGLTNRQFEIATLMREGKTITQIGAALGLSTGCVGAHITYACRSLILTGTAEFRKWVTSNIAAAAKAAA